VKHRAHSILILVTVAAILLASGAARAQSIEPAAQIFPERFVNGKDVGESTRPVNLNPHGINFADCMQDMVFQYSVTLSNFPGANGDTMQVWATNTGDCTVDSARGIGVAPEAATCWLVNGLTQPDLLGPATLQFRIPVRALVGPQANTIPKAGTLVGDQGPFACQTQPSFTAVPITVWFLPVLPNGLLDHTATRYSAPAILADLVGPPSPANVEIEARDTQFLISFTPNKDADTAGYDVFIDPPPGAAPIIDAGHAPPPPGLSLVCPDAGAPAEWDAEEPDGADDANATAYDGTASASGCYYADVDATSPASVDSECTSTVLMESTPLASVPGVFATGVGGIADIPCEYLVGASCPAASLAYDNTSNATVTGEASSAYNIKGLTDGVTYDVVVAAVDGSGNVGTPSAEACDSPAPVSAPQGGGQRGGCSCALGAVGSPAGLPVVGVGLGAAALTLATRRRRDRRRGKGGDLDQAPVPALSPKTGRSQPRTSTLRRASSRLGERARSV
jgi:hypothetical protein